MFEAAVYHKISDLLATQKEIYIAYSGGLDSHVLLHLLANFYHDKSGKRAKLKLTAVHVNHNLSPKAEQWVKHCCQVCKKLHVRYVAKEVRIETKLGKSSLEERLRDLRYGVLAKMLPKDGSVLTAHQADDQAETLLLQLFRGAGPKGLAAMAEKVEFAKGWLVRPLLNFSRDEILQYALQHNLKWVEDESNTDIRFDRNLIRQQLMPIIKKRWHGVAAVLGRVASHCAEANELMELLAEGDLQHVISADHKDTLDIVLLKNLSFIRQKNVLRFWLQQKKLSTPSEVKLNEVIRAVVNSRYDATPVVNWVGAEVRRYRNKLYAMSPLMLHNNTVVLPFYLKKKIKLPSDLGVLKVRIDPGVKLDSKKIAIKFRQGGEKIKLPSRSGSRDLKKLMQEWGIPPWLRDRIPLVYYDTEIIAVVGYYSIKGVCFEISSL